MGRRTLREWVWIEKGFVPGKGRVSLGWGMKRRRMSRVIWPSHLHSPGVDKGSSSSLPCDPWRLLFWTCSLYLWIGVRLLWFLSYLCHVVATVWSTPRLLASLYIPCQDNEEPHPSALIGQQGIPPANGSPGVAWHHKTPPLKIHGGRGGVQRSLGALLRERECFFNTH